jgi:glucosamine--fructose-6-phosphate aminotransferase (isomerizing)
MCGVFGFAGTEHDVAATVGPALQVLEYRGYDSWGVSWLVDHEIETRKQTGRLALGDLPPTRTSAAIGHTRWATHGGVTDANAHPHLSEDGRFSVVHNGIIENASQLKSVHLRGCSFRSETDSEVVPHLIEREVSQGVPVADAIASVFSLLDGQNAIVVMDAESGIVHAIGSGSPLLVAEGDVGAYIASDIIAFQDLASTMMPLPDRRLVRLSAGGVEMHDPNANAWRHPEMAPIVHRPTTKLGAFDHFTQQEVSEQPDVIERVLHDRTSTAQLAAAIASCTMVILTGSGSAYFAARFGAAWITELAGKRALAVPASEFHELTAFVEPGTLVLAVTQSGETADVIDALLDARRAGARIEAIVNVPYSTVARMVDQVYPLHAGFEQSVLATKSLTAKLARLYLAAAAGDESEATICSTIDVLRKMETDVDLAVRIVHVASRVATSEHVFTIGRGAGLTSAQEAALKIKEGSYVHAEAIAAGELKHGTIALIEPGTPCLIFSGSSGDNAQLANTSQELLSRGAYTIGVGMTATDAFNDVIAFPHGPFVGGILHVYVAQRIAYHTAVLRGLNPDRPRNLAKSVTVR